MATTAEKVKTAAELKAQKAKAAAKLDAARKRAQRATRKLWAAGAKVAARKIGKAATAAKGAVQAAGNQVRAGMAAAKKAPAKTAPARKAAPPKKA